MISSTAVDAGCWTIFEELTVLRSHDGFGCMSPERAQERSKTMASKKKNADGTPKRQRSARLGDRRKTWRTVSGSVAANAAELPQAAIPLSALDKIIAEADQIFVDQAAFLASKQMT